MPQTRDPFRVLLASDLDPQSRSRNRTVFSKTTTGCVTCKSKKVKCDESKPICRRCTRNNWLCSYSPGKPQISQLSSTTLVPWNVANPKHGAATSTYIHHVTHNWDLIFPFAKGDVFIGLFQGSLPVRHAVLGIAASHLHGVQSQRQIAEHRHAALLYQYLAVRDYRSRLHAIHSMQGEQFDQLLLTGVLLHILAFPLVEAIRTARLDDVLDLSWLALQAGLRIMIRSAGGQYEASMRRLAPVFGLSPMSRAVPCIPSAWTKFFGLHGVAISGLCDPAEHHSHVYVHNRTMISEGETFLAPVLTALRLRDVSCEPGNVFLHFGFLLKMHSSFRTLLEKRDVRAVWLYGYWAGLMGRFDVWWARERSRRDYKIVCEHLEAVSLEDVYEYGVGRELWMEMMGQLRAFGSASSHGP